MSEQRVTVGILAELLSPVGKYGTEKHQNLEDRLDLEGSKLKVSYGGDLIIYIHEDTPSYEAGLVILGNDDDDDMQQQFIEELESAGIAIVQGNKKTFVDNWYDGSDAPHMMLTLKEAGF